MGLKYCFLLPFFFFHPVNAESSFPSTASVKTNSVFGKTILLPEGFSYKVISGDNNQISSISKPDMNVLSPDGKFLYTSHEIRDKKTYKEMPSLTRLQLATGKTTTLIKGLYAADGLKWTPWNTLLLGQEFSEGFVYEVNPENGHHIKRPLLGMFSHEGIAITPNGIVYLADEHQHGAIYKFIPDNPLAVDSLSSGTLYTLSKTGWIKINNPMRARQESIDKKVIFFDRPEDMEAGPDGNIYIAITGENRVICINDSGKKPVITDYISADAGIIYPDNLVFHPNGDLYILQDIPKYTQYLNMTTNGIWVKHSDRNSQPGNIKLFASWAPVNSEPSGAVFSHDGQMMYINRLESDRHITGAIFNITGFHN